MCIRKKTCIRKQKPVYKRFQTGRQKMADEKKTPTYENKLCIRNKKENKKNRRKQNPRTQKKETKSTCIRPKP